MLDIAGGHQPDHGSTARCMLCSSPVAAAVLLAVWRGMLWNRLRCWTTQSVSAGRPADMQARARLMGVTASVC